MGDTTKILRSLRNLMRDPQYQLDAYIVPTDDAHQSEYICPHDERRAYISGFDGSAGTAVVTSDKALLWTDGRYYQQATKQLDGNWTLMKDGLPTTPSISSWLAKNLTQGNCVGVDPKLISYRSWYPIQKELSAAGCVLKAIDQNLVDSVWGHDQPPMTSNPVFGLDLKYTGSTIRQKWDNIKSQMTDKNAHSLVVSGLDEIAWFLNLRGTDIEYNPVFFSYLIVTLDRIILFIDPKKLPDDFDKHQDKNSVKIHCESYDQVGSTLSSLVSNKGKIWISPTSSYYLTAIIPKENRHQEITPITLNKAIKNETETKGFINCHIRDGIALCQYFAWLEEKVQKKEHVDEISGATKLEEFRSKQDDYKGLSFETISASGPNGSVIHYQPTEKTNRQINDKEIYLCDSGAQYMDGTTDVTRTYHFGEPTDFQREAYTRVLQGQLDLGSAIFPTKIQGRVLDTLPRKALWDIGLDYRHGTGHGVGHFLNVHEGPMGVGFREKPDDPGLQENMILSNEPGYYQDGEFGIRIEDIVQIVPAKTQYDFGGRGALTFKTITMCPKQTKMIKIDLLSKVEVQLINDYHREVWDTLSPILKQLGDTTTLKWLEKETKAI